MTLIQVIDAARALCNEPLDSTRMFPDNTSGFWTDSNLIIFTNLVQQDIALEIVQTFEDYFVTQTFLNITSGCASYTLPAGFQKMRRVEDVRTQEPTEIFPVGLNERPWKNPLVINASATYWDGGYYFKGNQIVFTDTPTVSNASAIQLYFVKTLSDISNASDTSDLPGEHHRLLVWGLARYMLFQQQSDTARADLEYDKMMQKLKMQVEDRQVQRTRKVNTSNRGRWR